MSGQEARLRLSACRWANEDRRDAYFAEALDQAVKEPELARWWEAQRALDDILSRKLLEVPVPATLRKALSVA